MNTSLRITITTVVSIKGRLFKMNTGRVSRSPLPFLWTFRKDKRNVIGNQSDTKESRTRERLGQLSDTARLCIEWQWSVSHAKRQWIQSYSKRWRSIALRFMYQEDVSADLPIYVHPATVGSSIKFTVWRSVNILNVNARHTAPSGTGR